MLGNHNTELIHGAEALPWVCAAIVGRLGTAPLGAVGLSTLVFNFSNFLFSFLMTVTTPRVAVAAANGNRTEVRTRLHRAQAVDVQACALSALPTHLGL